MGTHQTVRLIPGRHTSPQAGACVMELASMLAGEDFTDEPACVCPVIAEFLRTYNDRVDTTRRQDLYPLASLAVNTRGGYRVERSRANECLEMWMNADAKAPRIRRRAWRLIPSLATRDIELAHRSAIWASDSPERHAAALELMYTLCGGRPVTAPDAPAPVALPAPCEPSRSPT